MTDGGSFLKDCIAESFVRIQPSVPKFGPPRLVLPLWTPTPVRCPLGPAGSAIRKKPVPNAEFESLPVGVYGPIGNVPFGAGPLLFGVSGSPLGLFVRL